MSVIHGISVILTLLVTIVAVGSVSATIGSWKHSSPPGWFLAGAVTVLVAQFASGLLQIVLTLVPILLACALPTPPEALEATHMARHRRNQLIGKLGLILAIMLLPYLVVSEGLVSAQRTAVAHPTIVSSKVIEVLGSNPYQPNRLTTQISYTFSVDGVVYRGVVSHKWSADQIASAKVCYDPNDIAGSHSLELADYQCGSFDLHPNG